MNRRHLLIGLIAAAIGSVLPKRASVRIRTSVLRWYRIDLEAVGVDVDGSIRPISELRYSPIEGMRNWVIRGTA